METLMEGGRLPNLSLARNVRSMIIVRFKALGDIVLSLPIVYACRRQFPNARIRYLCSARYAEALSGVKELDDVLLLPRHAARQAALAFALRREKVDCVIDLLGSPRSALLTYLTGARMRIGMDTGRRNWCYQYLLPRVVMRNEKRLMCYTLESNNELVRMLGLETGGTSRVDIGFPAAEREMGWAREYMGSIAAAARAVVGIVPGAAYQAKSWPEECFVELGNRLVRDLEVTPLILWGPGEEGLARRVAARIDGAVLAPRIGIARLGALISMLAVLVGPDSGPKHLAVIQGVPTVTLFGPTDPRIWDPLSARHRVLTSAVECSPCRRRECEPNRCMSTIVPGRVFNGIADVLGPRPTRGADPGRSERA
jgi:ADP-heptose:LPS heptosyltransferase